MTTIDTTPQLTACLILSVRVGAPQELGDLGGGRRRAIPILSGSLQGSGLQGEVLPGGADWQTLQPDGTTHLTARYTVRLQDGSTLGIVNRGIRRAEAHVAAQLAAGIDVDPALYYFMTTPRFEIGPGPHHWLTQQIFIARGVRHPQQVLMHVYRVD